MEHPPAKKKTPILSLQKMMQTTNNNRSIYQQQVDLSNGEKMGKEARTKGIEPRPSIPEPYPCYIPYPLNGRRELCSEIEITYNVQKGLSLQPLRVSLSCLGSDLLTSYQLICQATDSRRGTGNIWKWASRRTDQKATPVGRLLKALYEKPAQGGAFRHPQSPSIPGFEI